MLNSILNNKFKSKCYALYLNVKSNICFKFIIHECVLIAEAWFYRTFIFLCVLATCTLLFFFFTGAAIISNSSSVDHKLIALPSAHIVLRVKDFMMSTCFFFRWTWCVVSTVKTVQKKKVWKEAVGLVSLCKYPRTFTMGFLMGLLIAYLYLRGHEAEKKHRGWRRNLYAKPTPCSLVLIFQCCNNQHHVIAPAKAITIICMSTVSLVFPYSAYRKEDSCCFLPLSRKQGMQTCAQDGGMIK